MESFSAEIESIVYCINMCMTLPPTELQDKAGTKHMEAEVYVRTILNSLTCIHKLLVCVCVQVCCIISQECVLCVWCILLSFIPSRINVLLKLKRERGVSACLCQGGMLKET